MNSCLRTSRAHRSSPGPGLMFRLRKSNLIPWIFIILPFFIDQIDGFIFEEFQQELPISKIYKTPLLLFSIGFVLIFSSERKYKIWLSVFMLFVLISQLVSTLYAQPTLDTLLTDFGHLLKIFAFPILYFFFMTYFRTIPLPSFNAIKKLYLFLFFSFSAAIIFSFFGFGIPFYGYTKEGESIGQQGYFISGNAISAFYLLISSIFYFIIIRSRHVLLLFAGGTLSIMIGLLMGSKTAILSSILCFIGVYVANKIYEKKTFTVNKSDTVFLISITGFIIFGIIFFERILDTINPIYRNYSYRYRMSDTFLDFITNGRVYRAAFEMNYFAMKLPLPQMLFGRGYSHYQSVNVPNTKFSSAEIDFIDILHIAGFVGVLLIYSFWFYLWYRVLKNFLSGKHEISISLLIALSVLILNSNLSGHIIHSALLNLNLAFLAAYAMTINRPSPTGPQTLENRQSNPLRDSGP